MVYFFIGMSDAHNKQKNTFYTVLFLIYVLGLKSLSAIGGDGKFHYSAHVIVGTALGTFKYEWSANLYEAINMPNDLA